MTHFSEVMKTICEMAAAETILSSVAAELTDYLVVMEMITLMLAWELIP